MCGSLHGHASRGLHDWQSWLARPSACAGTELCPLMAEIYGRATGLCKGKGGSIHLADFSRGLVAAVSPDELLPRMAQAAAQGLGAARARVRVYVPGSFDRSIAWPPGMVEAVFERSVPVLHQGAPVGEIAVSKPPGEPLTPAEDRLLADLAAQSGAALNGVRLDIELQARLAEISVQATELRASRQRIVSAQDAERRRLERDLHDGAQQYLVALGVNARLALVSLRDLARGIFLTALADRGVIAALEAHVWSAVPAAGIDADGLAVDQRFTPEVETAVYFCCLEALQNCAKHAPGATIRVALGSPEPDWLTFSVRDDGPGFDPAVIQAGSGHQHMADRLAALDGTLHVSSAPGQGTTVIGRLPTARGAMASHPTGLPTD